MKRRWHKVTMTELREIWASLKARGEWYNGCTDNELRRIYGASQIKHRRGFGWYKLTEAK